jgi:hypothetical protein
MLSMASHYRPGTQAHAFARAHDHVAAVNETMPDLLFGLNPISDDELRRLIEKRPQTYSRFAGYLGTRPQ